MFPPHSVLFTLSHGFPERYWLCSFLKNKGYFDYSLTSAFQIFPLPSRYCYLFNYTSHHSMLIFFKATFRGIMGIANIYICVHGSTSSCYIRELGMLKSWISFSFPILLYHIATKETLDCPRAEIHLTMR